MAREDRYQAERMARQLAAEVGREVALARTNLALSRRAAALLAGLSPDTQARLERGDPSIGLGTACAAAQAVGLKLWTRAYPVRTPSLRDTGQLTIAEILRRMAAPTWRVVFELRLGEGRSADAVLFGPDEIIHAEIERLLADGQAQYRSAVLKRDELAAKHQRPVRLVLVVEDTERNRAAVRAHAEVFGAMLPATSRQILHAIRTGGALGRDGLLWLRPRHYG